MTLSFGGGNNIIGILVDLGNAFGTLNCSTRLDKLARYDVSGVDNNCFKSYCRDYRKFAFCLGVPHSLFINYLNNIFNYISTLELILYPGDWSEYFSQPSSWFVNS